jgi:pyruvate formate lyase activating enzyme
MDRPRIEAVLYERLDGDRVRCGLCHHGCVIEPGSTGICGVRSNENGELHSLVYGVAASAGIDPIEKKPIFHCQPGHDSFSFAAVGCNFQCRFCQNHRISQAKTSGISGQEATPELLVETAVNRGCLSISCTYSEPTVWFEYAAAACRLARGAGLHTVFVTNGFMTGAALDLLGDSLTCANVDLKAYDDQTYRTLLGGRLQPVLDNLVEMKKRRIWVEVTTLLIPGLNDSDGELGRIAGFIADSLGPETPWHVSRYHPDHHYHEAPATPPESIHRAVGIGIDAGLRYVYCGNLPGQDRESTFCWNCDALLIRRTGFMVRENRITAGSACPDCGAVVDGIGMGSVDGVG